MNKHTDDIITKLSDYSHSRQRTEMYLGSRARHTQSILLFDETGQAQVKELTWVPALLTYTREILDNALDEIVGKGFGDTLTFDYNEETMEMSVSDNGRGIPITWSDEYECHMATLALSHKQAGRNFNDDERTGAGLNGLGAAVTNYCSEWFNVEIHRDGKKFIQEFHEGNVVMDELVIKKPVITPSKSKSGTKISFKPSKKVFEHLTLPMELLKSRLIEIATCNPTIKVIMNGQRIKVNKTPINTLFNNFSGLELAIDQPNFKSTFYVVTDFNGVTDYTHSIVNNVPTFEGGEHVDEFKRVFYSGILEAITKEASKQKLTPIKQDIQEELLIFNITNMKAPYFANQAKTKLINEEVKPLIRNNLSDSEIYKNIIKKNKEWVERILERTRERTFKKDTDEVAKMAKKNLRLKIPKLMDATARFRKDCILLIAEGNSALAGLSDARNPEVHGGLPLRGKVMNVSDLTPKRVLENEELCSIMNSIGLVIGQKPIRANLRYGKVYIATDMDQDGSNIAALLINFFYKFFPDLFDPKEPPFFHIFLTPFIIAEKGKTRKYWYGNDVHEFDSFDSKGWAITRAKGLGTLLPVDWEYALTNPRVIQIFDDGKMKATLDLIFNNKRADDRKLWMSGEFDV